MENVHAVMVQEKYQAFYGELIIAHVVMVPLRAQFVEEGENTSAQRVTEREKSNAQHVMERGNDRLLSVILCLMH